MLKVAQFIIERVKQMRKIDELLDRAKVLVKDKDPSVLERFEGLREVFEYFQRELELILVRWEEHKRKDG